MKSYAQGLPGWGSFWTRAMDIVLSALVVVLTSPLLVATALAIFFTDFGPAFYFQRRVGLSGNEFEVFKFRSMRLNDADVATMGKVGTDHPLITPVGRIIRRLKIDELPQIFNVLLGDMSLVGPRPTIIEQVREYDEYQRRRLSVRPGMTGWAQVNGGIELSWPERIALDIWYVDHWSPALELKIYLYTFAVIVRGDRRGEPELRQALDYQEQLLASMTGGR